MNSKVISTTLLLTVSSMILFAPTVFANISYAQLLQPTRPSQSSPQTPSPAVPSSSSTTTALPDDAITITSPQDGQKIPIGQDLEVTGTSIANAVSDCKITVNLNRIKPYQPAVADGPGGANDYSQWSFTITSQYAPIQEGQNRVAAKIGCGSDPNSNSTKQFAHVNVTGVAGETSGNIGNIGNTAPESNFGIPGIPS
ncbi:MAG: hypothetical protein WA421_12050 [Nitrososphaeraceae archaeon]